MKVGIMGAMSEEIERLKTQMQIESSEKIGSKTAYIGKLEGQSIVLIFSGWGKVAAASTATLLIERYQIEQIIFTGVAGGVNNKLNVGDIVISNALVQHDMDCAGVMGIKRFEVPLVGIQQFIPDESLQQRAEKSAQDYLSYDLKNDVSTEVLESFTIDKPTIHLGLIASGDQFITSQDKLHALRHALPNLLAVEMEGAAVAQVAHAYDLPFIVIRTISDKADDNALIDFPRFLDKVASHFTAGVVIRYLQAL